MFTGIVEEVGSVSDLRKSGDGQIITVNVREILSDVKTGDSISVDGVCLTVQALSRGLFSSHISSETISLTTLGGLFRGASVNLERALTMGGRLGGHIVSGHVDGIGEVTGIDLSGGCQLHIKIPRRLLKYLVLKGSVAVNGISLTVAKLSGQEFGVAVVPHTLENTTLKRLKKGEMVNIECDMLAKYVENLVCAEEKRGESGLTAEFLGKHGF